MNLLLLIYLKYSFSCSYKSPFQFEKRKNWLLPNNDYQDAPWDTVAALIQMYYYYLNIPYPLLTSHKPNDYIIFEQIGKGGSARIFYAQSKDQQLVTLKYMKKQIGNNTVIKSLYIQNYIRTQQLPYIHYMIQAFNDTYTNLIVIVHQTIEKAKSLRDYNDLSLNQLVIIFYKVLKTLNKAHSLGIMHRDIKSRNILYNRDTKQVRLIDWNLSDFYIFGKKMTTSLGTMYYNPPEVLLNYSYYDYQFDIWGVGVILAEQMLRIKQNKHLFDGYTKKDILNSIATIMGTDELKNFIRKYNIKKTQSIVNLIQRKNSKKIILQRMVTKQNYMMMDKLCIDLINKMLVIDHRKRISAKEALNHKFFQYIFNIDNLKYKFKQNK